MRSILVIPTRAICNPIPMIVPTFTDFGIIFIIMFDTPVIENIHSNTPKLVVVVVVILVIIVVIIVVVIIVVVIIVVIDVVVIIVIVIVMIVVIVIITVPAINADVNACVIDRVPLSTKLYVMYVDSPTPGASPNGKLPRQPDSNVPNANDNGKIIIVFMIILLIDTTTIHGYYYYFCYHHYHF